MQKSTSIRTFILALSFPLMLSGCLQIDTTFRLEKDGGGTITERLRFSRRLLEADPQPAVAPDSTTPVAATGVRKFLSRAAALKRMKGMGKGVQFVSHQIQEVEDGALEAICVYKIPDATEFTYGSPFLAYADAQTNNTVRFHMRPILKSKYWGEAGEVRNYYPRAGDLAVAFRLLQPPIPQKKEEASKIKPFTPLQNQTLRRLLPAAQDMFRNFKLKFTFESYAAIRSASFGFRGNGSHVPRLDLIHFTDASLDHYGRPFIENEELMLNLLRWKLGAKNIVDHITRFPINRTLPVFLAWGSRHHGLPLSGYAYARHREYRWKLGDEIYFPPSQQLFDRYFKGKQLNFSLREKVPDVPADFKQIGYQESTSTSNIRSHRLGP